MYHSVIIASFFPLFWRQFVFLRTLLRDVVVGVMGVKGVKRLKRVKEEEEGVKGVKEGVEVL